MVTDNGGGQDLLRGVIAGRKTVRYRGRDHPATQDVLDAELKRLKPADTGTTRPFARFLTSELLARQALPHGLGDGLHQLPGGVHAPRQIGLRLIEGLRATDVPTARPTGAWQGAIEQHNVTVKSLGSGDRKP